MISKSDVRPRWTRRALLGTGLAGAAIVAARLDGLVDGGAIQEGGRLRLDGTTTDGGRLSARPSRPEGAAAVGLQTLEVGGRRHPLLYVPAGYRPDRPAPLAVMLHGAGGGAENGLDLLRRQADDAGLILLAPPSRGPTWDVITGGFGPDVASIDRALGQVFGRYAVDPHRLVVGGFSDGASYALSLGLTNGDLFTHVVAFSPGFMAPGVRHGKPRLFLSHGTDDRVLPIDHCSRRIVPRARRAGYDVTYLEFDGNHSVPAGIAKEAVAWLAAS